MKIFLETCLNLKIWSDNGWAVDGGEHYSKYGRAHPLLSDHIPATGNQTKISIFYSLIILFCLSPYVHTCDYEFFNIFENRTLFLCFIDKRVEYYAYLLYLTDAVFYYNVT